MHRYDAVFRNGLQVFTLHWKLSGFVPLRFLVSNVQLIRPYQLPPRLEQSFPEEAFVLFGDEGLRGNSEPLILAELRLPFVPFYGAVKIHVTTPLFLHGFVEWTMTEKQGLPLRAATLVDAYVGPIANSFIPAIRATPLSPGRYLQVPRNPRTINDYHVTRAVLHEDDQMVTLPFDGVCFALGVLFRDINTDRLLTQEAPFISMQLVLNEFRRQQAGEPCTWQLPGSSAGLAAPLRPGLFIQRFGPPRLTFSGDVCASPAPGVRSNINFNRMELIRLRVQRHPGSESVKVSVVAWKTAFIHQLLV